MQDQGSRRHNNVRIDEWEESFYRSSYLPHGTTKHKKLDIIDETERYAFDNLNKGDYTTTEDGSEADNEITTDDTCTTADATVARAEEITGKMGTGEDTEEIETEDDMTLEVEIKAKSCRSLKAIKSKFICIIGPDHLSALEQKRWSLLSSGHLSDGNEDAELSDEATSKELPIFVEDVNDTNEYTNYSSVGSVGKKLITMVEVEPNMQWSKQNYLIQIPRQNRFFSVVTDTKTKKRNRLGESSLNAVCTFRSSLQAGGNDVVKYKISDDHTYIKLHNTTM